jgi:hypothetical protein
VTAKMFSLLMAFSYRRAQKYGGRIWWVVLAAIAVVRAVDAKGESTSIYRVKDGENIDVAVRKVS